MLNAAKYLFSSILKPDERIGNGIVGQDVSDCPCVSDIRPLFGAVL